MTANTHYRINNWLTVVVIALGLYIALAPLYPLISFWVNKNRGSFGPPSYVVKADSPVPKDNRLNIPAIGIDEPILDGQSADMVDRGVWRLPSSGSPATGSNTVLVSHRYSYVPGVNHAFYNLDKVNVGDKIYVAWQQKSYVYVVKSKQVVPPTKTEVQKPTPNAQLTLYTCTPLWTSKERLVLVADPEAAK